MININRMERTLMPKKLKAQRISKTVLFTVVLNAIILFVGYIMDLFPILATTIKEDGTFTYTISNSNLMFVITQVILSVVIIYHSVISCAISEVKEGVKKVEAHLINYGSDSIKFEYLSAIELELGTHKQTIHNEIWILTDSFEEIEDSNEGKELRAAILANLKTNVDYYYVVPGSCIQSIMILGEKLKSELGAKKITGTFRYVIDNTLNFIPTPYYDIIMYLKIGPGQSGHAETSSQIYYCFSKSTESQDCLYLKIDRDKDEDTWKKLTEYVSEYKKENESKFQVLIEANPCLSPSDSKNLSAKRDMIK